MSTSLKELLEKFCSKGFESKPLGDFITDIRRGVGVTKDQIGSGVFPCLQYGEIYTTYEVWFDKCVSRIDPNLVKNPRFMEYGDIVFTNVSENTEDVGKVCAYLGKEKAIVGLGASTFKHNQDPKYLAYALSTKLANKQKFKLSKHGSLINLSPSNFKKIKIPLPPIEIQQKIVEILDNFRLIEKTLKDEVQCRRKQFDYYKNLLLKLGGG